MYNRQNWIIYESVSQAKLASMTANPFCVSVLIFWFWPERVWQTNKPPKIQPLYSFQSPQALKISPTELSTPLSDTLIVVFSSAKPCVFVKKHQHRKKKSALDQSRLRALTEALISFQQFKINLKLHLKIEKNWEIYKLSVKIQKNLLNFTLALMFLSAKKKSRIWF